MFWLVVDENDRVIGSVGYRSLDDADEVWLHRLFVKYNHKHEGIVNEKAIGTMFVKKENKYFKQLKEADAEFV